MTSAYLNFDLLIDRSPTGGNYRARVIQSPAGAAVTDFVLPFAPEELDGFLWRTATGERQIGAAFDEDCLTTDLRDFGARLYGVAFAGSVGIALRRSLDEAERRAVGLRIRLRLDPAVPDLAELPWEVLYSPDLDRFLVLSDLTPIVRYIELDRPVQPLRARLPLTALAVIANPNNVTPLAVEQEWQNLQAALNPLVEHGTVALDRLEAATLSALQARLRRGPVDLLHFVGHGYFDPQRNTGGLVFESELGRAERATAKTLGMLLHDHEALRLIFLNACQGAQGGRSDSFAGVAQRLVQQGVPAVLAMQFPISDSSAVALSQAFYEALADGLPADTALSQARKSIAAHGNDREWATPVLFSRSDDNRVVDLRAQKQDAEIQRSATPQVSPPPDPMRPPDTSDFVGREQELAFYTEILRSAHFAVITGMPGVGKTTLASRLATRVAKDPDYIFWHQFRSGESIEVIIWQLAGLLARNGQDELWQMLQIAAQFGGKPPPTKVLLDYLFQLVRGRGYMICLDDFHNVEDDELVEAMLERLQSLLPTGQITIIITSRQVPVFVKSVKFAPLKGLDRASIGKLLHARGLSLPPASVVELHRRIDGNAELLILAAEALRLTSRPERVIERLIEVEDVAGFLLREVDERLEPEEKIIMSGVAVLLDQPGTRDAIEATLDTSGIRRNLHYLSNRYLLMESEGRHDREYLQHTILQAFYYDLLGRRERQAMHRRAGAHYEREEPDQLRAALHFHLAAEPNRAAELATADIWAIVNQGKAPALRALLEALEQSPLDPEKRLSVFVSLGDLYEFLDQGELAQPRYLKALDDLAQLRLGTKYNEWKVRACLGMGTVLEHQTPEEALRWLEQGLRAAADATAELQAAIHNRIGTLRIGLAQYDAAVASLQQALSLLPELPSQLRANVLNNLGAAFAWCGDVERSGHYTAMALELSRQLCDPYGLLSILSNIGIDKEISGNWTGASADYHEALKLAEKLGSSGEQARILNLLGTLHLHQGNEEVARDLLSRAIIIFRQIHNPEYLAATLSILAQLHIRQQAWEPARLALAEAESLATAGGWDYILPETYTTQALLALGEGEYARARERAEQGIAGAAELGQAVDEGKAWRAKGQVMALSDQLDDALAALKTSMALLDGADPYEAALTQVVLANVLASTGDHQSSVTMLSQATRALSLMGVEQPPLQGLHFIIARSENDENKSC